MGQTTIMLMLLTILSKIFGFVREAVMASFIGAGDLKSIYTTSNTMPVVMANFVAVGIASGFIPIYNRVKNEEGEKEAEAFTSNIVNILMVFGTVAVIIGVVFARPFSKILSPDLEGAYLDLATNYTRIMMFAVFGYLYSSVFRGYLNLKGNFLDPAITGIIMNIFIIAFTILTGITKNPYLIIIGALLGNVLQYALFPRAAKKRGYKHKKIIDINNKYVRSLMVIAIPVIISSAAGEISIIIDNSMASAFFGKASVSKLFYSKTMLTMISGIITVSVTTAIFPRIAEFGAAGNIKSMKRAISSSAVTTMLLVIPASVGMAVLARPIVSVVFERNAFSQEDTIIVAALIATYAPNTIFQSMIDIIDRGFYAVGDSKTPVVVVLIQQGLNILFNLVLVKFFGLYGLAIATVASAAIGSVLMLIRFRNKFGAFNFRSSAISIIKISIITVIMALVAKGIFSFLNPRAGQVISLFASIFIAALVYGALILFARIPEVMNMVNEIYHKVNRKIKGRA